MKVDNNQVATINLQELHDILANGDLSVEFEDHGEVARVLPSKFVLEDDDVPASMAPIMIKLNALREELQLLDGEFHDEFDGAYC